MYQYMFQFIIGVDVADRKQGTIMKMLGSYVDPV